MADAVVLAVAAKVDTACVLVLPYRVGRPLRISSLERSFFSREDAKKIGPRLNNSCVWITLAP
jgi:hypothetical protein